MVTIRRHLFISSLWVQSLFGYDAGQYEECKTLALGMSHDEKLAAKDAYIALLSTMSDVEQAENPEIVYRAALARKNYDFTEDSGMSDSEFAAEVAALVEQFTMACENSEMGSLLQTSSQYHCDHCAFEGTSFTTEEEQAFYDGVITKDFSQLKSSGQILREDLQALVEGDAAQMDQLKALVKRVAYCAEVVLGTIEFELFEVDGVMFENEIYNLACDYEYDTSDQAVGVTEYL